MIIEEDGPMSSGEPSRPPCLGLLDAISLAERIRFVHEQRDSRERLRAAHARVEAAERAVAGEPP
jgi:hypothetical protein